MTRLLAKLTAPCRAELMALAVVGSALCSLAPDGASRVVIATAAGLLAVSSLLSARFGGGTSRLPLVRQYVTNLLLRGASVLALLIVIDGSPAAIADAASTRWAAGAVAFLYLSSIAASAIALGSRRSLDLPAAPTATAPTAT